MHLITGKVTYNETKVCFEMADIRKMMIAFGVDPLALPQELTKQNTRMEIEELYEDNGTHSVGLVLTMRY